MTCLQTLRRAHWLTRLVLLWFALFLGAAVASPMVKPASGQMVCTAMGGMKMVMDGDDGQASSASASMECPLCAQVGAPPAAALPTRAPVNTLAHALRPLPAAHIAWLTSTPLPPRGPPARS